MNSHRELLRLGNLFYEKCALDEAREVYRQAFELARAQGDVRDTAEALARRLRMASEARDEAEISTLDRELRSLMAHHPDQIPAMVWYCQAVLAGQRNRWRESQTHLRQYLRAVDAELQRGLEVEPEAVARGWVMLANTFTQRGHLRRAELLLD